MAVRGGSGNHSGPSREHFRTAAAGAGHFAGSRSRPPAPPLPATTARADVAASLAAARRSPAAPTLLPAARQLLLEFAGRLRGEKPQPRH